MTRPKRNDETIQVTKQDLLRMLTEDDAMKGLLQTRLQEVLEVEMDDAQRAGKNERTSGRLLPAPRDRAPGLPARCPATSPANDHQGRPRRPDSGTLAAGVVVVVYEWSPLLS
jgi:hypothetical protein